MFKIFFNLKIFLFSIYFLIQLQSFNSLVTNEDNENYENVNHLLFQEVHNIRMTLQNIYKKNIQSDIIDNIILLIKSEEFSKADEKLSIYNQLTNSTFSPIKIIVHEIYANNIGNFHLLLKWIEKTQYREIRDEILLSLLQQIERNQHYDAFKLIDIYKLIQSKSINSTKPATTDEIIVNVRKLLFKSSTEDLKTSLMAIRYYDNVKISQISDEIEKLDSKLFEEIIADILSVTTNYLMKKKLIDFLFQNNQNCSIILIVLLQIIMKWKIDNDNSPLLVADYFSRLQNEHICFKDPSFDEIKEKIQNLLPITAQILFSIAPYQRETIQFINPHKKVYFAVKLNILAKNFVFQFAREEYGSEYLCEKPKIFENIYKFEFEGREYFPNNYLTNTDGILSLGDRNGHHGYGSLWPFKWEINYAPGYGNNITLKHVASNRYACVIEPLQQNEKTGSIIYPKDSIIFKESPNSPNCHWLASEEANRYGIYVENQ